MVLYNFLRVLFTRDLRWSVLGTQHHVETESCSCITLGCPRVSQGIIRVSQLLVLQDEKGYE